MGINSMWSGCRGCARCLFYPTDPSLTEQCEGAPCVDYLEWPRGVCFSFFLSFFLFFFFRGWWGWKWWWCIGILISSKAAKFHSLFSSSSSSTSLCVSKAQQHADLPGWRQDPGKYTSALLPFSSFASSLVGDTCDQSVFASPPRPAESFDSRL